MQRRVAILASSVFVVLAPGFVAGFVPWSIGRWRMEPAFFAMAWLRWIGWAMIAMGGIVLLDSVRRFAVQGLGTPAPVLPTRHLVVTGLYRYVRNPMYVAVLSTIFGQGLLFANRSILLYGAGVGICFHLFVLLYEEPTLRAAFGGEYEAFSAAVPRWVPRRTPWIPKN